MVIVESWDAAFGCVRSGHLRTQREIALERVGNSKQSRREAWTEHMSVTRPLISGGDCRKQAPYNSGGARAAAHHLIGEPLNFNIYSICFQQENYFGQILIVLATNGCIYGRLRQCIRTVVHFTKELRG